jgi:hypothetical protein
MDARSALRVARAATLIALAGALTSVAAQPPSRIATSVDALLTFPGFFHSRQIALVAEAVEVDAVWQIVASTPRPAGPTPRGVAPLMLLVPRTGAPPSGRTELRGTFVDVGRLIQAHELTVFPALATLVQNLYAEREPSRGTVFALVEATWTDAPSATPPSVRTVALSPAEFDGKTLTLRGRFRGQNLFGDLPFWPRQGRWDFVLQSADASIWVTGLRPRGRGFDLDPTSKRNAGTWLEVTGAIVVENATARLEATAITQSDPEDEPAPEPVAPSPAQPPPTLIFSVPIDGETDVPRTVTVRAQFSRDMAPDSFADRIRVTYAGDQAEPVPPFTAGYRPANRGLDIRFDEPLVRGASVLIHLLPGITATDGTPLVPTTIAFTVER